MPNRRFNKQVANQMKSGGRVKRAGGGMGGRTGDMMYSRGQGMNMKSKRVPTELMDRGAMKKGGRVHKNTRRMNRLEELGRVDAEKGFTRKGKKNLKAEKKRIVRELKK